jgi:UDP-N-acetylmuramoylalanine--D-glutamate ligase
MKIAMLGYGIEGKSVVLYFLRHAATQPDTGEFQHSPGAQIDVFDQRSLEGLPEGVNGQMVADFTEVDFSDYDLVFRTPTVLPEKILTSRDNVTSVTSYFFEHCPVMIVGVTATKGKGTTSTMIASILRASGRKVHLVGNIGISALDVLDEIEPDDIVVYEMGVSQTRDMRTSPQIAVIGTIAADHLDLLGTFEKYVDAKANVARFQKKEDLIVFYGRNEYSRAIADRSPATRHMEYPSESGAHVADGWFCYGEEKICKTRVLELPGEHNIENALAAISAVWGLVEPDDIEWGLSEMVGLPHRIEFVREVEGVKYYDDNFSSATPAAEVAVKAFDKPVILIAGGFDRGLDYTEFTKYLVAQKNLKKVLLIGQTKDKLAFGLWGLSEKFETLDDAVVRARELAEKGDVVVMSPGAPSFDMFKDFKERGEKFQELVQAL